MKHIVLKLAACLVMAGAWVGNAQAGNSSADTGVKPVQAEKSRKKTGASGQVRFLPGSAETARERSSRLKRECQGRVNAGACAGYTR